MAYTFTPDEIRTGRIRAFTQIPKGTRSKGRQFPANHPEEDFDAICLHRPEVMFGSEKRTAKFFGKMASPYHAWLCGPDATRQTYSKKLAGSRIRNPNAKLKPGYADAIQRIDFNTCGWALKNDDGGTPIQCEDGEVRSMQTNRRGRLLQITLAGWSADSSFTTDEDYKFYAWYIALSAAWLKKTNPNGTDFRFDPWQKEGNIGTKHMPDGVWMSPNSKRLMDHGGVPSGNSHWDVGPLDFAKLCEMAEERYERILASSGAVTGGTITMTAPGGIRHVDPADIKVTVKERDGSRPVVETPAKQPAETEPASLAKAQELIGLAQLELTKYRAENKPEKQADEDSGVSS